MCAAAYRAVHIEEPGYPSLLQQGSARAMRGQLIDCAYSTAEAVRTTFCAH